MIERAAAATPEDLMRLHGRVTMRDPRAGEAEATAGGVTFRRGAKVVLRPDPDRDPYDRMLARPAAPPSSGSTSTTTTSVHLAVIDRRRPRPAT